MSGISGCKEWNEERERQKTGGLGWSEEREAKKHHCKYACTSKNGISFKRAGNVQTLGSFIS